MAEKEVKEVWIDMTTTTRDQTAAVYSSEAEKLLNSASHNRAGFIDDLERLNAEIEAWYEDFKPAGEPDILTYQLGLRPTPVAPVAP